MSNQLTKMYILIPDDISLGHAINSAAHAGLACYLQFKDDPDMRWWLDESFKKVTVKVTRAQFNYARNFPDVTIITESALNNLETALAFKPRVTWPKDFNYYPLYK